jgi:hypothetical protein
MKFKCSFENAELEIETRQPGSVISRTLVNANAYRSIRRSRDWLSNVTEMSD